MRVRLLARWAALAVAVAGCTGGQPQPAPLAAPATAARALATPTAETPVAADAFVDSIGVNTHMLQDLTADNEAAIITQRVRELGVRHVRDGIFPNQTARQYADERTFLAATGAGVEAITDCPRPLGYYPGSTTPPRVIRGFDDETGGHIELLEGPNEPDLRGVAGWGPLVVACIEKLRLDRTLPVPFVAPAMGNAFDTPRLGNISQVVDVGAIHRYFSGHNPGTHGFWKRDACGEWGQMRFYICEARINAGPSVPLYITETGYSTNGEVDETTLGKYVSRVLLIDSLGGIARTYIYELHDDGTDPKNSEDGYGLIRYDGTPKPAFNAVRNEIALLSDPGPAFAPAPLQYGVSGVASLRHELFEKRNGTYLLAVWNETASWNPNTLREIPVAPSPVAVTFAAAPATVAVQALDDAGHLVKRAFTAGGATVRLEADDHVAFVQLTF